MGPFTLWPGPSSGMGCIYIRFESKVSGHYHSKYSICLLYFRTAALWSDRRRHKMKRKPHSALLQSQCNQNGKNLDQTRMCIKPWSNQNGNAQARSIHDCRYQLALSPCYHQWMMLTLMKPLMGMRRLGPTSSWHFQAVGRTWRDWK